MVKSKYETEYTCDCCKTVIKRKDVGGLPRDWTHIYIYRPKSGEHSLDICPDCYRLVEKYLEENCDINDTWPKNNDNRRK